MNAATPAADLKPDAATPASLQVTSAKPRQRRALMLALPVALLLAAGGWWLLGGASETTENANLHQARIAITSDLAGRVVAVNITDNQTVKAGDVLFQVDPEPYRLALARADAALAAARLSGEQLKLAYAQAQMQARVASDEASYQASELARQQSLSDRGAAATAALDTARHTAQKAEELRLLAEQGVAAALVALNGDPDAAVDSLPQVMAAQAARDAASYDLALTTVKAPADGIISQAASFKVGQRVAVGASLFALVETSDAWVEANFKETQLGDIKVGQAAEVEFDLHPGVRLAATVQAIGAGTGSEFSVLPAQNATGNWVKVTQRVPVRLQLDDDAASLGLASGLSASVTVTTGPGRGLW
ncbi:HlyD family secretion protein [Rhodobacter ferrooxidans]|uniref:Secretion protein HlyD family protein n=1 Tax=Rhodobacter ferrooxidans TaxID=371731 RepID=C8S032_9RHOB|nr:HlyD family secretion protein [Rhodobacter sp. SW2]EEW25641.1 secretion protein HlyD family protein [Rhodobacter sp. SW2]